MAAFDPTRPAARVRGIALSVIKEMAMRGARVPNAASLAWGLPSFPTPAAIRVAVSAALAHDANVGKYALPDGLPELRNLAAARHQRATGMAVNAETQVVITAGNMQGMSTILHTLLDPGDEVIVTDPGFASHVQQIELAGGVARYWPLRAESGWQIDLDTLPALVTPRTRALILVSPSNPTGTVFRRDALLAVGALAREHGFTVLLDDPYSEILYEHGAEYFNLAAEPAYADHLVYLFTFSKSYAMSGWRVGYMILPPALKAEVLKVHDANLICAPRVSQAAAVAALQMTTPPAIEFARVLGARRERICARLDAVPHVFDYSRPEGAYYVFPRIVAPHVDARSFALDLLDRTGVVVTPGSGFGPAGEHHVRLAFCVGEDVIDDAFDRIERRFGREQ